GHGSRGDRRRRAVTIGVLSQRNRLSMTTRIMNPDAARAHAVSYVRRRSRHRSHPSKADLSRRLWISPTMPVATLAPSHAAALREHTLRSTIHASGPSQLSPRFGPPEDRYQN